MYGKIRWYPNFSSKKLCRYIIPYTFFEYKQLNLKTA